jgi:hypothetical protein
MLQLREHLRRLGAEIQSKNPKLSTLALGASYNWDENRINIGGILVGLENRNFDVDECRALIREIREDAGYDTSNSRLSDFLDIIGIGSTIYSDYFRHIGYRRTSEPKNLTQELDKIFRVEISLGKIKCNGPLVGSEIFVAE